jgi:hypothetical protein
MKAGIKRILLGIGATLVVVVAITLWGFFSVLRTYEIEDRINNTFYPISEAIERFAKTNGVPPKSLNSLVPAFWHSIPTSPLIDKIEYTVVDGTNWIMNVHSTVLKPSRTYSWRSNMTFSDEEQSRILKQFHDVTVLKD